jgi:hypothetical protein
MRFLKFLGESNSEVNVDDLKNLIKTLKSECSQFIQEFLSKDVSLYRGIKGSSKKIWTEIKPRTNRLPKNTPEKIHDLMDAAFKKKFGWKVRSEGVFAVNSFDEASIYGKPYLFLPKNGYKYVYSPKIQDLMIYLDSERFINFYSVDDIAALIEIPNDKHIDEILSTYKDSGAANFFMGLSRNQNYEISFKCSEWYAVDIDELIMISGRDFDGHELFEELELLIKRLEEKKKFGETNLPIEWRLADTATLKEDFLEYSKKENTKWKERAKLIGMRFPVFNDFEDFKIAYRNGIIVTVKKNQPFPFRINNLSHTDSIEELKDLVSSYKRPRDVDRIVNGMKKGDKIPIPIVLKGKKGYWIMAGNTRINVARILGKEIKFMLLDVSK